MADLNVFELTNQELHKSEAKATKATKKASKKSVKESISRKSAKRIKPFQIPANKIKCESLSWYLKEEDEGEETDITADYTPDDDVVLVIDPEMDEVPDSLDDAEEQAEELIGQHVCKCAICGANYVTDAEITEELELEDEECPVCGETGEQIVVGVITPTEELSSEDEEEVEGAEEVGADDAEDEIEVTDDEDGGDVEVDVDEFETEDEDDFGESVKRSRARTLRRKAESIRRRKVESARKARKIARPAKANKVESKKTVARKPSARPVRESKSADVTFDEATLNRMLTRFAKENYSNVKFVNITSGTVRGNRLTLEGVVTTTKGSKRPIKFISENFKADKRMTLRFKEQGPFTESVKNVGATFIVECAMRGTTIVPISLRYNYQAKNAGSVKESKNTYSVTGKILSESVRRPARKTARKNRK